MYSALLQCQNNRWILVTLGNSKLRCSIETYLENCLDAPVKKNRVSPQKEIDSPKN